MRGRRSQQSGFRNRFKENMLKAKVKALCFRPGPQDLGSLFEVKAKVLGLYSRQSHKVRGSCFIT